MNTQGPKGNRDRPITRRINQAAPSAEAVRERIF